MRSPHCLRARSRACWKIPKGALTNILLYHVVAGKVMAADVLGLDGQQVETVGGQPLTITIDGDTVKINDASSRRPTSRPATA